jgi:hypothetical protein
MYMDNLDLLARVTRPTILFALLLLVLTDVAAQEDEPELASSEAYWQALYAVDVDLAVCLAYFMHRMVTAKYPDERDLWNGREHEAFAHLATWHGRNAAVHLTRVGYQVWTLIDLTPAQWQPRYRAYDASCGALLTRLRPDREEWLGRIKEP